jgi:hypothetical protein
VFYFRICFILLLHDPVFLTVTNGEEYSSLEDNFLYAQFFSVQVVDEYFVDIIEFLSTGFAPREFTTMKKKYLVVRYVDY